MSKVLLTGATGTVGFAILRDLLAAGREVRALVRSIERAESLLPDGVELAKGDVTDARSVAAAAEGCSVIYHGAGLPEQWLADDATFDRVNVEGTRHLVDAAIAQKVERFVYTSTIDVFRFEPGVPFDESVINPEPMHTPYERSKQKADALVTEALDRGLQAVFLHPSGVYGPAAAVLPGLNDVIARMVRGEIPMLLPGGMPVVHAADVAAGHVSAEKSADVGERFILSVSYIRLVELAGFVADALGKSRVPPVLPTWVAKLVSEGGELVSRATRSAPMIPRGQLHFLSLSVTPDAAAAKRRLGWSPRSAREGIAETIRWIEAAGRA